MAAGKLMLTTDESKFGQKMLESMGWKKGDGLGANRQGSVDPISISHKDDTKGVGFKGHGDTWIAHQDDFSSVLAQLNKAHGKEKSDSGEEVEQDQDDHVKASAASLEAKSKKLKKRVHYQKFTRGKDLSRYSSQDLDCILGSKAVKVKRKVKAEEEKEKELEEEMEARQQKEESSADSNETKDKVHGVVTIARGSISDYFAQKMKAKALGTTERKASIEETDDQTPSEKLESKKKSKKSRKTAKDERVEEEIKDIQSEMDASKDDQELKKKKKKKKSSFDEDEPEVGKKDKKKKKKQKEEGEEVKEPEKSKKRKKNNEDAKEEALDTKKRKKEEGKKAVGAEKAANKSSNPSDKLFQGSNILTIKGYAS